MKQRYNRWMKSIRPSESYQKRLESEMNRELLAQKSAARRRVRAVRIAAAAAAVMILSAGALALRGALPDRVANPPVADGAGSSIQATPAPAETAPEKAAPAQSPSFMPSPTSFADPTPLPSPSPTPASVLEALDQGAWPSLALEDYGQFVDPSICLADRRFEIHETPDADSPVLGTLAPGDAYWPVYASQESGDSAGNAERITWWNGTALQTGWRIASDDLKAPGAPPYELVRLPGKVRRETALRYGRDPDAAAVATLNENALIYLYARYGDWLYVTTNGFDEEQVWAGWLPVDSVWALKWRDPTLLSQVELLAERVNLRDAPDGKIIATLSRAEIDAQRQDGVQALIYTGTTVPGKSGDWYFVTYGVFMSKKGATTGYLSAEFAKIHSVTLGEELDLDGVVSAALRIRPDSLIPDAITFEQTLTGEALEGLKARLKGAGAVTSFERLCIPGIAEIRLTYADGSVVPLAISADDCPRLAFNGMIYDYRTAAERTEAFLNEGGKSAMDVLPEHFDQLTGPMILPD